MKPDPRLEGKKAIVADAHRISSHILADELEVEGLKVTRTSDYTSTIEALEKPGKGFYDVALVDLSVSETYEIFDRFQQFDSGIKVILMSRFGANVPADVLNHKCTLSFVRPAPRKRYVSAVHDALNPQLRKQAMETERPEQGLLKTLATRHPLNILLAEDNPVNTRVALQHLKRMGYSAKHAKDGIEVLELCEAAEADETMFDVSLSPSFSPLLPSLPLSSPSRPLSSSHSVTHKHPSSPSLSLPLSLSFSLPFLYYYTHNLGIT